MNQICALIQKELRLSFNSPIAYIFIIGFLSVSFWFFFKTFFLAGQLEMRSFFDFLPWIFLFLLPAFTMRLWSEEYRLGTIETLLTSSLSIGKVVCGKFLASVIFLVIVLVSTLTLPLSLSFLGSLDWGAVFIAYIGSLLLGTSYIALGLFMSALTNNQIVAFIVSVIAAFLLYILGESFVTFALPGFIVPVFEFLGLGAHYHSIIRGVIDTKDLIYYLSFIGFFLFMNVQVLKGRK